jgi:signal transduction histidine kinase
VQVLVSDLQDISRIEASRLKLEPRPTALGTPLDDALYAVKRQIEDRDQRLTVDVPDDLPSVHADVTRLRQILVNLLSNANKYTPEGGRIRLRAWAEGNHVHCAVSDTGVGISPEEQAQLFTKFFRSENPAVQDKPGTGLGLYIVRSLVAMQGGWIDVESQPGEGTTVTFTVPVVDREGGGPSPGTA